eukprot:408545-Pyramimonas_sp.AAC.1
MAPGGAGLLANGSLPAGVGQQLCAAQLAHGPEERRADRSCGGHLQLLELAALPLPVARPQQDWAERRQH